MDATRDEARLVVDLFRTLTTPERMLVEEEANAMLAFLASGAERRTVLLAASGQPGSLGGGGTP